jgi:phage-related holin
MNYLSLIQANLKYIIIICIMMILDTVTGFAKAFFIKNYQSSKARKCFSKILSYLALIFSCLAVELLLSYLDYTFQFTKYIIIAMVLVEFSSIAENFEVITGKNFITDTLKFVINKIKILFSKE